MTVPVEAPVRVPLQVLQVRSSVTGPLVNAAHWATWSGLNSWALSTGSQLPVDAMDIPIATIFEGESPTYVARVVAPNGVAPLTADIEAVQLAIFDVDSTTGNTAILTDEYTPADVWFDTMQRDQYWRGNLGDDGGYNFRAALDQAGAFPDGGRQYLVEFHITSSAWGLLVRQGSVFTKVVKEEES